MSMAALEGDQVGDKVFETGVDRGVLYIPTAGVYDKGYAWSGLTTVTESPSGAEPNKQYADNQVYVNLESAEEYAASYATGEPHAIPADVLAELEQEAERIAAVRGH